MARMRLPLVINTDILSGRYRLEVIADYCLNFGHCVFEPLFILGSLESSYSGLPIRVNWTFFRCYGWGATSEYWLEIGVSEGDWSVSAKFTCITGCPSRAIFCTNSLDRPVTVKCLTTLSMTVTQRNFVADFLQANRQKGLGNTVRCIACSRTVKPKDPRNSKARKLAYTASVGIIPCSC